MCEELFKENLAVKYSLYRNTLPPKDFRLIQEFYAWLSAQQTLALDGVDSAASEKFSTPEVLSTLQGESNPAHRK